MNEEEIKETLKTMKENIDKKYLKTRNSEAIETILNLLEKKDKQISKLKNENDEMAETLRYYNGMQQEQCFCIDICGEKECDMKNCKDRIKQYFERKVDKEDKQ